MEWGIVLDTFDACKVMFAACVHSKKNFCFWASINNHGTEKSLHVAERSKRPWGKGKEKHHRYVA